MKPSTTRCQVCDRRMSLCTVDPLEGEVHGLRVRIEGLPVMACPKGHRRFVAPDFAVKLAEALRHDRGLIPMNPASRVGPRRRRFLCPACGSRLDGGTNSHVGAKRVLELNGRYAFGLSVDVPRLHCTACGSDCVPPDDCVIDDVLEASAHALRSVDRPQQ